MSQTDTWVPHKIGHLFHTRIANEHTPLPESMQNLLLGIYELDLNLANHSLAYRHHAHQELVAVLRLLCKDLNISSLTNRRSTPLLNETLTLRQQSVMVDEILHRFAIVHQRLEQDFGFKIVGVRAGYVKGARLFEAINTLLHRLEDVKVRLAYAAEVSSTPLDPDEARRAHLRSKIEATASHNQSAKRI